METIRSKKVINGSYSLNCIEQISCQRLEIERATLVALRKNPETGVSDVILLFTRRDSGQVVSIGSEGNGWLVQSHFDNREQTLSSPYKAMELAKIWLAQEPGQLIF